MTEYGVTDTGFRGKTFEEIVEDKKEKAKEVFDRDLDLGPDSALTAFIETTSFTEAVLWQALEETYYQSFFRTATGQSLEDIVSVLGIDRQPARGSTGTQVFVRSETTDELTVPRGTRVSTRNPQLIFETTEVGVFEEGEDEIEVGIRSEYGGEMYNVAGKTITSMLDSIGTIIETYNPEPTSGGKDKETDVELRTRAMNVLHDTGAATGPAIKSNLLANDKIYAVRIVENTQDEEDEEGRPPHSFEPIIYHDMDQDDIGQMLWEVKPLGINSYGDITVEIEDESGYTRELKYTEPSDIGVYIVVESDDELDETAKQRIETDLEEYFEELFIGDDVIFYKIVKKVMNHMSSGNIYVGTEENPDTTDDIEIDDLEYAFLSEVSFE